MTEKQISLGIYRSGVIVDLSVSSWRAIAKLDPREVGLESVPQEIYLGHKNLMRREYLQEISSIECKAGSWLVRNSWSFPVGQCRFLSYATLPKALEKMKEFENLFYQAVDRFVFEYAPRRDEMIAHFNLIFDEMLDKAYPNGNVEVGDKVRIKAQLMLKLEAKYPRVGELRSKFSFDFIVFEVTGSDFRGLNYSEATDKANTAIVAQEEYRKKIGQKMDAFSESVINRLQTMVLQVTGKLSERTKAGKLNQNTIKGFRNWVARFRELNFIGLDVDQSLNDLERKLNDAEKSDLSSAEFQAALERDIQAIQETASKTDVSTVLHKYRRRIDIS
jgi:hypothetical protein